MKTELEARKYWFDYFKHLTTLCTGTIVILATFLDTIFTNPEWPQLVGISFSGFAICLIFSLLSMMIYIKAISANGKMEGSLAFAGVIFAVITLISFLIGIVSLIVFSIKNFY